MWCIAVENYRLGPHLKNKKRIPVWHINSSWADQKETATLLELQRWVSNLKPASVSTLWLMVCVCLNRIGVYMRLHVCVGMHNSMMLLNYYNSYLSGVAAGLWGQRRRSGRDDLKTGTADLSKFAEVHAVLLCKTDQGLSMLQTFAKRVSQPFFNCGMRGGGTHVTLQNKETNSYAHFIQRLAWCVEVWK